MTEERRDCGCVSRPWPGTKRVREWEPCRPHGIASRWLAMLHWPGHEECCDLPPVREAVEAHGVEAVREAVATLDVHERGYASSLVDTCERERTS